MYTAWVYVVYLVVSVALTVWVGRTLFVNGRVFLVDAFSGNEALAGSVNHLLVVGFYLINIGFVSVALKYGTKPHDLVGAIEFGSTKIGLVLLVVGVMHFFNLCLLAQARKRGIGARRGPAAPPARRGVSDRGEAVGPCCGLLRQDTPMLRAACGSTTMARINDR